MTSGGLSKKYFLEIFQKLTVPMEKTLNSNENRGMKHSLIIFLSKLEVCSICALPTFYEIYQDLITLLIFVGTNFREI